LWHWDRYADQLVVYHGDQFGGMFWSGQLYGFGRHQQRFYYLERRTGGHLLPHSVEINVGYQLESVGEYGEPQL
jgi:hypothetical protein